MSQVDLLGIFLFLWLVIALIGFKRNWGRVKTIIGSFAAASLIVVGGSFAIGVVLGVMGKQPPGFTAANSPAPTKADISDDEVDARLDKIIESAPRFVHQDAQEYGYQMTTNEVVMIRYYGERDGVYQFAVKDIADSLTVYVMSPPYKFAKALVFFGSQRELLKKETFAVVEDSLMAAALQDAKAGKLKRYMYRDKKTAWVTDANRLEFTPVKDSTI